ncbi:MAG: tRNA 2-thiouridine(34) synthase MnmA [Victivallaceae bacterium]|nr:tRNA 2-thiouridine(34) synthase MnmA [Victivallaceae bacterium]
MSAKPKILVALSGGVDSSVAAAMLVEEGYEVIGATLSFRSPDPAFAERQHCGAKSDFDSIEQLTAKLGIRHYVLDRYHEFESRVLRPSWEAYRSGLTPNPCCLCNPRVKFGELIAFAREQGCLALATGHYARIENGLLRRGRDRNKDQSYFLYRLTPEQLAFLRFPLGGIDKTEVRRRALALGLTVAAGRKESQDACFACDGECFAETLRRLFGELPEPGDFIYNGRKVGRHPGVHCCTIGQRKGLNVALGVPAYVAGIDAVSGEVELVTDEKMLECNAFAVEDLVLHRPLPANCFVQIRYRTPACPASVSVENGRVEVVPETPLRAVTPGQSAVFYDGEYLLGGGIIK